MNPAGHRVVGDAFEADVSDRRAELYRFYVGPVKHAACDISKQVRLAIAFLNDDEFAAADVGDAFGVIELCALGLAPGANVMELSKAPVLLTSTTDVPPSPTTNNVLVSQL